MVESATSSFQMLDRNSSSLILKKRSDEFFWDSKDKKISLNEYTIILRWSQIIASYGSGRKWLISNFIVFKQS